jgi:hypothetical protein
MCPENKLLFDIASHIGTTVEYIEDNMTIEEVYRWGAYFSICPPLNLRFDIMMGQAMSLFVNANSKKRHKASEFIPEWDKAIQVEVEKTDEQKFNELLSALTKASNQK